MSTPSFYWKLYQALAPFIHLWARPKYEGSNWAVNAKGPVILASNHTGHMWWDSLVLLSAFPDRQVHVIAHYWDASVTVVRKFLEKVDAVFLQKDPKDITEDDPAVELLKADGLTLIYPEESYHTFWNRYTTFRFAPHSVRYAELSGAPIVPVALIGVEEAAPCLLGYKKKGVPLHFSFLPPLILPLSIKVVFGEPISADSLLSDAPPELSDEERWQFGADKLQRLMHQLVEPHRPKHARLSDDFYIDYSGF